MNMLQQLEGYAEAGWKVTGLEEYKSWMRQVTGFLSGAGNSTVASAFRDLGGVYPSTDWIEYRDRQAAYLDGLAARMKASSPSVAAEDSLEPKGNRGPPISNRVFVVHGHDSATKEAVARFVERLRLVPVILHEQPSQGNTTIEKFEEHANVAYAVVLLTPDDVGASVAMSETLNSRARQNVILELGYFIGKLGRKNVCALFKPGVEIPSDFAGVVYVELDGAGAWKAKLAQEFVTAGLDIKLEGLLG